jgi:hypothetical protein
MPVMRPAEALCRRYFSNVGAQHKQVWHVFTNALNDVDKSLTDLGDIRFEYFFICDVVKMHLRKFQVLWP